MQGESEGELRDGRAAREVKVGGGKIAILSCVPVPMTETVETFDFEDGNGPVPAARHRNPDGSEGGWVARTAYVASTAFVGRGARVFNSALVFNSARIYDAGWLWGDCDPPALDAQRALAREICAELDRDGRLEMKTWHTCSTTHCLAGWAQVKRGGPGEQDDARAYEFGIRFLPALAPLFFAADEVAQKALRELAEMG